jgi:hypothetical protein
MRLKLLQRLLNWENHAFLFLMVTTPIAPSSFWNMQMHTILSFSAFHPTLLTVFNPVMLVFWALELHMEETGQQSCSKLVACLIAMSPTNLRFRGGTDYKIYLSSPLSYG